LFEAESPFFIFQSKKMAAILSVGEALLTTGQPISIVWKRRLKESRAP
jgi:hypothetical protein